MGKKKTMSKDASLGTALINSKKQQKRKHIPGEGP